MKFQIALCALAALSCASSIAADALADAKSLIADFNQKFKLRISDEDIPAFTPDNTAVKALDHVQIVASNGLCFDVSDQTNEKRGDFRANLVVVLLKACDSKNPGQLWSVITKGKHIHDNRFDGALIVSELNFHVIDLAKQAFNAQGAPAMFAAGGRAVGDGDQIFTQQFFFNNDWLTKAVPLVYRDKNPKEGNEDENIPHKGASCLTTGSTADGEPRIRISICDPKAPKKEETFKFVKTVNSGQAAPPAVDPPAPIKTLPPVKPPVSTSIPLPPAGTLAPAPPAACPDVKKLKRELQIALKALGNVAALLG